MAERLTDAEIEALRTMERAATAGPWKTANGYEQSDPGTYIYSEPNGLIVAAEQDDSDCVLRKPDADLIVAIRNVLLRLLDELEEFRDG